MANKSSEIAEKLIKNGYQPIPIPKGQKGLRLKGWQASKFTPTDFGDDANIGIRCGDNRVAAIDIDITDATMAAEAVAELERRHKATWMVRTGQAPKCLLPFRYSIDGQRKTIEKLGDVGAIEVLATGQQFVAFGLHPAGHQYTWRNDFDPTDGILGRVDDLPELTPEEIADFLAWAKNRFVPEPEQKLSEMAAPKAPPSGFQVDTGAGFGDDRPCAAEVREILSHIDADIGYDDWLKVLMGIHDWGGGSGEALTIADTWSARGSKYKTGDVEKRWAGFNAGGGASWASVPALARDGGANLSDIARKYNVARKVAEAAGNNGVSIAEATADNWDFDKLEPKPEPARAGGETKLQKAKIIVPAPPLTLQGSAAFCAAREPADYLVDGSLRCGWLYTLTAPTGHGKSAVALALTYAIASGLLFGSRETKQGSVLFLAGENHDDIRERWIALCEFHCVEPSDLPVTFQPGVTDLKASLPQLNECFDGKPLRLVIVDTLAAFFDGSDENANAEMQAFANDVLRPLTELPGRPTVVVPAHPTKGAGKDSLTPKGGSSLVNAVDGNLSAWNSDSKVKVHWQGKFRGAPWQPWFVELSEHKSDQLVDSKGRHLPTVLARPMMDSEISKAVEQAEKVENQVLKLLADGKSVRDIAEDVYANGKRGVTKYRVETTIKRLLELRWIRRLGRKWQLTEQGWAVLEQAGEKPEDGGKNDA